MIHLRRRREAQRTRLRTLPVPESLLSPLRAWLAQVQRNAPQLFPLSPRGVDHIVERCGVLASLARHQKLTPQVLRDTFATRQLAAFLAEETQRKTAGATPDELAELHLHHDRALLHLLGLSSSSAVAERYRQALTGSNQPELPSR